ncbi:LolA family protein [Rhodohalobacter halophilus]|uniref:LolA family protein n=1 Tax=Rhodohalobacter halophilus TaxID=1812810 RepID=UPI0015B42B89|nr:outer membrane lipoprotein carrier protein LolA [Rhodohalobacter halophilus]
MKQATTFALILLLKLIFSAEGFTQTPEFDRLKANFEEGLILEADFSHLYKDAFTGEEQYSEGKIWIGKEKYRIEGDMQSMVVDGEISTVFDRSRNRVIISEYIEEEDDFAPSRMLQGVDESFSVSEESGNEGQTVVTLASDDPFTVFQTVRIYLNENGSPERIVAVDQVENELITMFENGSFRSAEPTIFELNIPDEAEKIDLRYETE